MKKLSQQRAQMSRALTKFFPLVGLIIVIIFFNIVTNGLVLAEKNIMRIITQTLPLLLGTIGAAFISSQNALDMSMGSVLGLSVACAAYVSQISPALAIIASLIVGLGIGLCNGFLHGVLKINPMIATMAVSFIIRGLLQPICNNGSVALSPVLINWDNELFRIIVVGVFFVIAFIFFEFKKFGRHCKIVGASEIVATQSGINVRHTKIKGYLISGFAAGLAGFLTVLRSGSALPATGNLFEFDVLVALVLGGMPITGGAESRIHTAIIGAFMLTILTNGMTLWGIGEYAQQLTKGLIFLAVLTMTYAFRRKEKLCSSK